MMRRSICTQSSRTFFTLPESHANKLQGVRNSPSCIYHGLWLICSSRLLVGMSVDDDHRPIAQEHGRHRWHGDCLKWPVCPHCQPESFVDLPHGSPMVVLDPTLACYYRISVLRVWVHSTSSPTSSLSWDCISYLIFLYSYYRASLATKGSSQRGKEAYRECSDR